MPQPPRCTGGAAHLCLDVAVGPFGHERLGGIELAIVRRGAQRGHAAGARGVQVGAFVGQKPEHPVVIPGRGHVQRGVSIALRQRAGSRHTARAGHEQ